MMRCIAALAIVAVGVLGSIGAAASAQAAEQVPFTITEQVDFAECGVDTFTVTGSLCLSGTFEDTIIAAGAANSDVPRASLLIRIVYTCDDGSGTFNMQKHVLLVINPDGSISNTGPVQLHGGTGAYTDLIGHGVDNGFSATGETGLGEIEVGYSSTRAVASAGLEAAPRFAVARPPSARARTAEASRP
jgi:hypothetical protein